MSCLNIFSLFRDLNYICTSLLYLSQNFTCCSDVLLPSNQQLHTFPEGKVSQVDAPIRRLKWGTASLIVRAPVTPIVLPIVHKGFEEVIHSSLCQNYETF